MGLEKMLKLLVGKVLPGALIEIGSKVLSILATKIQVEWVHPFLLP
jgi:hypothetical protein